MSIGRKLYFFTKIKFKFFIEWVKTAAKFYFNIRFMIFDILFCFVYFFLNPYRTARKFLEKKFHKTMNDYGETPITEIEKIVKNFDIKSGCRILELGAGRGKISFWLWFFLKSQIMAIEQIPVFVKIANFFIKIFKMKNFVFLCKDYLDHDFENYDVIYLYGTTLSDEQIYKLIAKFKKTSPCVKIITVSYSLDEYDDFFACAKDFNVSFPWGKTKVYLNIKRS